MSKETHEHLSCLMDGELSQETALFVTRRMGSDKELGKNWERYHLIRDCIRRPGETRTFASIQVDLEMDDTVEESRTQRTAVSWLKPLAGMAVAAGVAAVAVLGVVGVNAPVDPTVPAVAQPFTSPNPLGTLPVSQPVSYGAQSESAQQMNRYLLRHNQAAGRVGRQGFVSFVPIVSGTPVQVIASDDPASADAASTEVEGSSPAGADQP